MSDSLVFPKLRIGHGFDAHRLKSGRDLWLGGVHIPFDKGLEGHSDADCVLHALCDACLGAACLGDIGIHFSDKDSRWHNISSRKLAKAVSVMLEERFWMLVNADLCIIAQKPALSPYFDSMRDCIAQDLKVERNCINLKATTTEKMGWSGRGEGIGAHAVVLLQSIKG